MTAYTHVRAHERAREGVAWARARVRGKGDVGKLTMRGECDGGSDTGCGGMCGEGVAWSKGWRWGHARRKTALPALN